MYIHPSKQQFNIILVVWLIDWRSDVIVGEISLCNIYYGWSYVRYSAHFSNNSFDSFLFWLFTVLLIVWPRSLLLCPFHTKLRIWWKKSFSFCQTDNSWFSCIMYCYRYRQLNCKNLEISGLSSLRKSTKRKSLVIRTLDFP